MITEKQINEIVNGWFAWQPRFHDEIIRNDKRLEQIRNYIRNNPNPLIHQRRDMVSSLHSKSIPKTTRKTHDEIKFHP